MIRKKLSIMAIALCICNGIMAQDEKSVNLKAMVKEKHNSHLDFALLEFELFKNSGDNYRVEVSINNLLQNESLMLFPADKNEKQLKKNSPKIVFDKTFGGDKGKRNVSGCSDRQDIEQIEPSEKTKFNISVDNGTTKELTIPFYFVKSERTWWGGQRIKILKEKIMRYRITVTAWNENDEQYVAYKNSVNDLISSLENVKFCTHEQHTKSVEMQQQPYKARIERLKGQIDSLRKGPVERVWMTEDLPHKAYTTLYDKLTEINLNEHNITDCGEHKKTPIIIQKCFYCSLSEVDIYNQLDSIYQNLRTKKITDKKEALKKASALYQCYNKHNKRKKTKDNKDKIEKFYKGIVGK